MNRRRFLSAAATLPLPEPARAAAGDKIRIGLIGYGWYGMADLNAAFKAGGVEAVALCDADSSHLSDAAAAVE